MLISLDLETTGLNPKTDKVIEVAIVRFEGEKIIDQWSSLVNPGVPIPEFSKKLTGIDDAMVKDAPTLAELKETILEKIGDLPIMGHFIFFDINFLTEHGFNLPNISLDTCQLGQVLLPKEPSYSLEVFSKKLAIRQEDAHRALDDVLACVNLSNHLLNHVKALSAEEKSAIRPILEKSLWAWAPFVLEALEQEGGTRIPDTPFQTQSASKQRSNLKELTKDLKPPFLLEEGRHSSLDLIQYAKDLGCAALVLPKLQVLPEDPACAVLKSPSDYLDSDRLQSFLAKDALNPDQSMMGLKLSLWACHTQTGDQAELRLHKEEKALWYDVCGEEGNTPNSFYKKALDQTKEKPVTILSHYAFLKDRCRKNPSLPLPKKILVGSVEYFPFTMEAAWQIRLSERRLLNTLRRIKEENPAETEILDSLATRISILFGFLGIFIERNGTPEDPRHALVLEVYHRNASEWTKVVQSSRSFAADLASLGNRLKASATLDELVRLLTYLEKIIGETESLLWLTQDMEGNPVINAFPESTRQIFTERVWKGLEELHLFAHCAQTQAHLKFLSSELAFPENLQFKSQDGASAFPIEIPDFQIPGPNDPQNIPKVTQALRSILPTIEADIFLLVSAKNTAEQFFYKLPKILEAEGPASHRLFVQNLGGGMGKIFQMSQESLGKNLFVGNESFLRFLLAEGMHLKTLLIHRLPFAVPSDPIQKTRASHYQDGYKEFALPQAILNLNGLVHQFLGEDWEGKRVLMLDPRYQTLFF